MRLFRCLLSVLTAFVLSGCLGVEYTTAQGTHVKFSFTPVIDGYTK